jgi:hypothetical protein
MLCDLVTKAQPYTVFSLRYLYYINLVKPGPWVYIAVGGANIQIVHYFDHGYLEELLLSKIFDRHGY